jgi:hypothetical protein
LEYINANIWFGEIPFNESAGKAITYKYALRRENQAPFTLKLRDENSDRFLLLTVCQCLLPLVIALEKLLECSLRNENGPIVVFAVESLIPEFLLTAIADCWLVVVDDGR